MSLFLLLILLLGLVFIGFVAIVAEHLGILPASAPRRTLQEVIEQTATETVKEYFASPEFRALVQKEARKNPRYVWTIAMASRFREVDKTMTPEDAWKLALDTTNTWLNDEKIAFGDPNYTWGAASARVIADEYEIDHWERP